MSLVRARRTDDLKLSENFTFKEFHCQCKYEECVESKIEMDLILLLEEVREFLSEVAGHTFPMTVTSGYRCVKHNDDTPGSVAGSQHPEGKAADIIIPNKYHRVISMFVGNRGGVGFYEDRLHIDVRGSRARWGKEP